MASKSPPGVFYPAELKVMADELRRSIQPTDTENDVDSKAGEVFARYTLRRDRGATAVAVLRAVRSASHRGSR